MRYTEIKEHLSGFIVGIAGAGGLGSNCAVALARSGVGTIIICDFDTVELSNLNRQYYFTEQAGMLKVDALKENIRKIDPGIKVITHAIKLSRENIPSVFKGSRIIVEAFDDAGMKEMLISTVQSDMKGTVIIAASGLAGWDSAEYIKCRKIDDTLYICGDEETEASCDNPPLAPRVGIVANIQANIVIDLLMRSDEDPA